MNDWVQNPRFLRGEVSGEDAATKWERIKSRGTALKTREQELDEREAALSQREASTDRRQAGLDAWQLKVQAGEAAMQLLSSIHGFVSSGMHVFVAHDIDRHVRL